MAINPQVSIAAQGDVLAVLRAALAQVSPAESDTTTRTIEPLPRNEMADALTVLQTRLAALFGSVMDPMVSSSVSHLQQLAAGISRDLGACLDTLGSVTEAFDLILSVLHASDGSGVSPHALIRLIEPLHDQLESINTDLVVLY